MCGSIGAAQWEVARAAQKSVLRIGGTPLEQGALESLSRPVQTYREVLFGHPERFSHLLAGVTEQIHAPQEVRIFGFQHWEQCVETGAYHAFELGALPRQGLLQGIGGFLPSACCFMPGKVRQHRPEQPGEPRKDTFRLAEVACSADCTEVTLLQDLFRSLRVPHKVGQQPEEIPTMFDQCRLDGGIQLYSVVRSWLTCHVLDTFDAWWCVIGLSS
jgi:hypothetical protein